MVTMEREERRGEWTAGGLRVNDDNGSCGGGGESSNDPNTGKLLRREKSTNYKEMKGHS